MEIRWNRNPGISSIICDERDKQLLKAKIQLESCYEGIFGAKLDLEQGDAASAQKELQSCIDEVFDEAYIEKRAQMHIYAMEHDSHCGDCTCVAASCLKCQSEDLLDVSTIEDFSKHSLYRVIGKMSQPEMTFAQAIHELENPKVGVKPDSFSQEMFDEWTPKWQAQSRVAAKELRIYKEKHFPNEE